ncbi:Peroxin/Dysferlin domain-containing protein [Flammula alnicola]|nr:Peroxin/Dysferlin domain-containing protein [Flammula alnicola]
MSSQTLPDSENAVPVLSDFLSSVPPALTLALVQLAPCISACKAIIQVSSWSTSWYHSWLALASWWAVCLFLDKTLRRFLPFVVFAFLALAQRRQKIQTLQIPTTEYALRNVITDLTIIQSLLPSLPPLSTAIPKLFRAVVILYIPYLALSFFVSFRVICAIVGTILLTWRAPWAIVLRATIWRSAWFRWSAYKAWAVLSGEALPPPTMSLQPTANSSNPVQSLRFLFTVYENQRWWMALDWTAALLPGERPSWCSSSQHPINPPNAFTLPENTTVYLPDENGGRLKRTATWKWEEPEWRVIVHKDGDSLSRVERPLPSVKEENTNSSRLLKAAGRLRESGSLGSVNTSAALDANKSFGGSADVEHTSDDSKETADEEPLTDADGWVYGDNKWEAQSNRGGLGKYTRYRRWTRIAVVFEEVERIPPGDIGIEREVPIPPVVETPSQSADSSSIHPPDSPLRQRLINALNKPSQ